MTKKRRKGPTLQEQVQRPWCFYCTLGSERDFDDMMILISHQKAKHFRCDKCNRRLNTAGGLSVHMNQVHKESLTEVENALPNRKDPNIEIFGTEGIPEEAQNDHTQRVTAQFFQDAADRQALTGNVQAGTRPNKIPKRPKLAEEGNLKQRLKDFVSEKFGTQVNDYSMQDVTGPDGYQQPYANNLPPGQAAYGYPPPGASDAQAMGMGQPPSVHTAAQPDQSMPDAAPVAAEDGGKKAKPTKLFYFDNDISPEEKMARMSKYKFNPTPA